MTKKMEDIHEDLKAIEKLVNQVAMDLNDAERLDIEDLFKSSLWSSEMKKVLAVIHKELEQRLVQVIPSDTKVREWTDVAGVKYRSELKWKSVRTAVDRDELVKAVRETVRSIDEQTGEIVMDHASLVALLTKAFRFEPRWTEIKELGIDPDQYCKTKYEAQVITTSGVNTEEIGEAF
ncbi:hypothetical protein UFOVP1219_36 [uncultured Caudovirales phage]|uniref:Uncharacterized protein n=1 Tax=uncultured Caudovirales phage TaxID=2100421 RepID=A0A6J5RAA4_9CAUD|nr:hypothetical protein UFOVP476_8 [uncultured Caudovirales phage]CAB4176807.1 hypothetical protein UFOVP986_67 [uncultured Caudovirales phage]CAB4191307.1 hypothetical protein UFOVP1219_36 [uncultured Caudovirales phage]CAB4223128.1 hypothetical protein UFOVP1671_11 [uncultured Caudovirales phage]CAB5220502.1 hypothetical protein UFOVP358_22 [uncultured Caudovirales phage]